MIRKILGAALATTALMIGAARAEDTIVWWDFLSGGDGVRMKAMLEEFNKEHAGKVKIDASTFEWGVPFYTKVQTSAAVGQGPDVMTYHESRMPLGISTGSLSPLTPEELAASGIKASDFGPANWKAAQGTDGKQYGVPLDIHSIILYYNKDLLKKAGLLGDDGKPKGLDGVANWDAALAKLTTKDVAALSVPADNASGWRVFYTLLNQQGGEFLKDGKFLDGDNLDKATTALAEMQKWVKNGWTPAKTEYPASIALFTSGKAAMHINGVWEVPTMVDLAKKGAALRLGRDPDPGSLRSSGDLGGLALLRDPRSQGQSGRCRPSARRCWTPSIVSTNTRSNGRAAVTCRLSSRCRRAPNSRRSSRTRTMCRSLRPRSSIRSRSSPESPRRSTTRAGNYVVPAMSGEMSPADAAKQMRDDLQSQAK